MKTLHKYMRVTLLAFLFFLLVTIPLVLSKVSLNVRAFGLYLRWQVAFCMRAYGLTHGLNTLTNLIPTLYAALDVVSRELVGFIPAVSRNSTVERAAVNQTVNIPIVPAITAGNITAAATPPDDGDQVMGNTTMTISKARYTPVRWTGEEQLSVAGSGMLNQVQVNQFAQAMRTLTNEIEADLAALHINSSRAAGVFNAVPFVTAGDFSDFAAVNRILDDNGAPLGGRHLIIGGSAMANLRGKQSVLFKANEAGTTDLLRLGIIGMVEGLAVHNSAQIKKGVAVGTASGATTDTAGYAVGATTINLASAGTGTFIAGDIVTFTGDTNQYGLVSGDTDTSNGGTIVLQEPGLRKALATSAVAIAVVAACDRNVAFQETAIQLATRLPALPEGGDMADDRTTITDPVSGLTFEVSLYRQYRRIKYEIAIAWGVKTVAPRHQTSLLGTTST